MIQRKKVCWDCQMFSLGRLLHLTYKYYANGSNVIPPPLTLKKKKFVTPTLEWMAFMGLSLADNHFRTPVTEYHILATCYEPLNTSSSLSFTSHETFVRFAYSTNDHNWFWISDFSVWFSSSTISAKSVFKMSQDDLKMTSSEIDTRWVITGTNH